MASDVIEIRSAPAIPGLRFRTFRGKKDFPLMLAALEASTEADNVDQAVSLEGIVHTYSHLQNCDPYRDMIFIEVDGDVVGYFRCEWSEEQNDGPYLYGSFGHLVPAWRRKGIGLAVLGWLEARLNEIAADHPPGKPKYFQGFASETEVGKAALLEKAGYTPARVAYDMVRPSLEELPDYPLPEGIEVRPVLPEHYRRIWEADKEAFRDHWGFSEPTEEDYASWLDNKVIFQPELWQIGWDVETDQVAGQVRTFIHYLENEKFNRKRGYTEFISVRRPWRRRGLARALIALSLKAQKAAGMTESALGVDSENLSGATRIYEDCGFRVDKRRRIYRKPLTPAPPMP